MSVELESAVAWLREQRAEMERLLETLVRVNSFTGNPEGGREVGARMREALATVAGLDVEARPSERFADHLVFGTPAKGAPVAIVGHLDTVFPPGTFEGYRSEAGVAYGPGVLDMKGGLVVAMFALRALAEAELLGRLPLRFVVVADEEVGSPESQALLREVCGGAAAALVLEGGRTNDAVITRRKGTGGLTAIAYGKAAHAGAAHKDGVNAIWALAKLVDLAQALTDYPRGVTVNVGKVTGGQGKNTVPDRAEAELDIRFLSGADGEALVEQLRAAARAASEAVPGARVELSGGVARLPLERSDASLALYEEYAACARASGLSAAEAPLVGGGSDANTLSSVGVPAIDGLGPRGAHFHTRDEKIELDTLVPKAEALVRLLSGRIAPTT